MKNNSLQPFCIKRMIDIIRVYGEESHLIKVSDENVEKALLKIVNFKIKPEITVKTALCNLEKFRPEIKSAFELQLFNVWYNAFKTLDIDEAKDIEEPVAAEESESVVEEVVEEEIIEEPVAAEESESVVEEVVEEEIIEEPVAAEESESVVEEVVEESESVVEEVVEEEVVEVPDSVQPEMKSVEEDEQQVVEKKQVMSEQATDEIDESEAIPKKRKRDWFDFLLDCSAAMTRFFIRILFKKRS
jgi:hypothetical protein